MNKTKNLILMALFAALVAIGAFIRIPTPIVPITMQYLFTMLAGVILGGKNGALSVLCYIFIGLLGLPVFAGGGGLSYVFQPTFGYLIGFVIAAFATGTIANAVKFPSIKRLLLANFVGLIIVYSLGAAYCWMIYTFYIGTGMGFQAVLMYCLLPFIPGDAVICVLAAFLCKRLLPIARNRGVLDYPTTSVK